MKILQYLRHLKNKFSSYRPTIEVVISRAHILHNFHAFKKMYPALQFAPVLKSNAYGHGLVPVAKIMAAQDIPFFVVDSLYEAGLLRAAGIKEKILVIGFTPVENILSCRHKKVSFAITSLEQLQQLAAHVQRATTIHIKIDTGMHRQGILPEKISTAIAVIKKNSALHLEGLCSHFATAHCVDKTFSEQQIVVWEAAVTEFKKEFSAIQFFHLANTAGAYFAPRATCNVVRLGIGLFGKNESPHTEMDLQPTLRVETVVSGVKKLRAGEHVGYNNAFTAPHDMTIATIPAGYFEGIDRRLSNCGTILVGGVECPIIGDVSMNITTIDITHAPHIKLGDAAIVMSDIRSDKNSLDAISKMIGEIPYVVLARIPQHLRRRIE